MNLTSPPERCLAIVVGIECYKEGPDWELAGAVKDAIAFADYLLDRNVKGENIKLFISDARATSKGMVDAARARLKQKKVDLRSPLQHELHSILTNPAGEKPWSESDHGVLLIYWSGHGFTDERSGSPLLYTMEASQQSAFALNLGDYMTHLKADPTTKLFEEQWIILDACREWTNSASYKPVSLEVPGSTNPGLPHARQYTLFATKPGKYARTEKDQVSPFTRALLKLLPPPAQGWPNLDVLCASLQEHFKNDAQEVDAWRWTPSQPKECLLQSANDVRELRWVLAKLRDIPAHWLQRIYRQIDHGQLDNPEQINASEIVARLTGHVGERDPGKLNFLCEFAVRLEFCYKQAKNEEAAESLAKWLEKHVELPVLTEARKRLGEPPSNLVNVQFEVPEQDNVQALRARWEGRNRDWEGLPELGLKEGIRAALDEVSEEVFDPTRVVEITLELRVPDNRLCGGIDHLEIDAATILGRDKLATLRLRGRGAKFSLRLEWSNAWVKILHSLERRDPYGIHWLANAREAREYMPLFDRHHWVAYSFCPITAEEGLPEPLRRPLACGAPLVLWPNVEPKDAAQFQKDVERLLKPTTLNLKGLADAVKAYYDRSDAVAFSLLLDIPNSEKPEVIPLLHPAQKA